MKYILDLLSEVGLLNCKPAYTPIVQNHELGEYPDQVPTNKERYQRLVGKLIYLSHTRPDIAYVVSVVSQFMHFLIEDHMDVVIRHTNIYWIVSPTKYILDLLSEVGLLDCKPTDTPIVQNHGLGEYLDQVPTHK